MVKPQQVYNHNHISSKNLLSNAFGRLDWRSFALLGFMAKEFAKSFYSSKVWQDCRNAYAKEKRFLCEECLKQGIIKPGEIVHHKQELTPETINDPSVTLSFDNLQLLCRDCHAKKHHPNSIKPRYWIDDYGRIILK